MAASRKNAAPTVALFPFLAVLMCTMGSLILLLLVTSHRIRERAVLQLQQAQEISELEQAPPPKVLPPQQITVQPTPVAPPPLEPLRPEPAPPAGPTAEEYAAREAALRQEWLSRVEQLNSQVQDYARSLRERAGQTDAIEADLQKLAREKAQLSESKSQTETRRQRLLEEQKELLVEREQVAGSLTELEERLKELRAARITSSNRFSMVAYHGVSGTTLSPIVIECTQRHIAFPAEGVVLTPEQISGFSPAFNPIHSGVAALAAVQQRQAGNEGLEPDRPYVLMLVRPEGAEAYYIARTMLADLPSGVGVELIPADMQLDWPRSSDEEITALQSAVSRTLQERGRASGGRNAVAVRGPAARTMDVGGQEGGFQLPEVEELRQEPPKKVFFGNREVVRESAPRGDARTAQAQAQPLSPPTPPRAPAPFEDSDLARPAAPPEERALTSSPRAAAANADGTAESQRPPKRRQQLQPPDSQEPAPRGRRPNSPAMASPRRWGEGVPAGRIGYERVLTVEVHADRLITEDAEISIARGATRETVRETFAALVDASVRSWGSAPVGFYWLPKVTLQVLPGGNAHTARLKGLADEWGLTVTIEQRLE